MKYKLFFFLTVSIVSNVSIHAEEDFWKNLVENIKSEADISSLDAYDQVYRFFYIPSFSPLELFQIYKLKQQWYFSHTIIRRIDRNELFEDENPNNISLNVATGIIILDFKSIEVFLNDLELNSFYAYKGNESEMEGFDGITLYFEYKVKSQQKYFYFWNDGTSTKYLFVNNIVSTFRQFNGKLEDF